MSYAITHTHTQTYIYKSININIYIYIYLSNVKLCVHQDRSGSEGGTGDLENKCRV